MKKYLITTALASIVLFILFYIIQYFMDGYLHSGLPTIILFFFAQSFPVAWLLKRGEKTPPNFPILVIGAMTFRMLSALFLLVTFYVIKTPELVQLSIQFTIIYLLYMILELMVILSNLRRN